jgi:hypothetical protein
MTTKTVSLMWVFAACAFGQVTSPLAPIMRQYNFPPVGLASTETAQVNVVNMATASSATGSAAPSCAGTISFVGAAGKTIGTPTNFTTTGSQIYSTQLTFSQLATTGTRGEFVASVQLGSSSALSGAYCSLSISLETFDDTTGVTHAYLGNPAADTSFSIRPIVAVR